MILNEILFFLSIGTIFFILDVYPYYETVYSKCNNQINTFVVLYFHHIFAAFFQLGWISDSTFILKMHLFSIFLMMIVQIINNGKCPLTKYVNNNCKLSERTYLRDMMHYANLKSVPAYLVFILIVSFISYTKLREKNVQTFNFDF